MSVYDSHPHKVRRSRLSDFSSGVCDVSKESINWILNKKGNGNAAIIVIGGAAEALDAKPGNYDLTLRNRKGFVRLALQNGWAEYCFKIYK